jgi:hypothetical protein
MIKGSSSALAALHERIARINTPAFQIPFGDVIGEEAVNQYKLGFIESRDPYGKPWKPLKNGNRAPLMKTKNLMNSGSCLHGVVFKIGEDYGHYHQEGTKNRDGSERIPVRQMVPSTTTGGMGSIWGAALNRVADQFLRDYLGGA